ncbi:unnamed protein product, partial [Nesidiocoris tenuis]
FMKLVPNIGITRQFAISNRSNSHSWHLPIFLSCVAPLTAYPDLNAYGTRETSEG